MGFGGIITTGISIAVLLVAGYMILAGLSSVLSASTASASAVQEIKADQINTALTIINITKTGDTTMTYNVTNNGSTTINDISCMDMIVKYVDPVTGQRADSAWLTPVAGDSSPVVGAGQWYSASILSPMRNTTGTQMLMPGETMVVNATLSAPHPADAGVLQASAPNGVCAIAQFDFRI